MAYYRMQVCMKRKCLVQYDHRSYLLLTFKLVNNVLLTGIVAANAMGIAKDASAVLLY